MKFTTSRKGKAMRFKIVSIIAFCAAFANAQNTITADAGRTTKADSLRWGGTRDSTTKLMARGNAIYRDSSSTWVAITTDSCSLPVKIGFSTLPNKKLEVSYEVRTSSGNTDSSQLKMRIDTRYCNGTSLANACDSWVPAGRYKGDTATYVIDSLVTVSTSSGTTWKPTRQLVDVPGGNQIRFCADGYRDGGQTGDTTFFRYFVVRQSAVPSGGIPPGSGTGGAGDASASNQTSGAQKTQIVDGSGNVIGATSNALDVNIKSGSGSGVSVTDSAAFTRNSSVFVPAGGFYQSNSLASPLATGRQGMVQMTRFGAFHSTLRDSAGAVIGNSGNPIRTDPTGTTTQPVSYATTGSGTATGALRVELPTNGTGVLATVGAVTNITNTVTVGGTAAADAAVSGNPVYVAGRASAAAPTDVSADGDVVPAWRLRNGAAAVQPTFAGILQSTGNGTAGTGTPRVTIASDNTAFSVNAVQSGTWTVQPGNTANTTGWFVAGGAATDAAVTGNPLLQGGRASTATPTAMSADGDAVPQWLDRSGASVVTGYVAHDAVAAGNPVQVGGVSKTSDPTATADGDLTYSMHTITGKQVTMPYSLRANKWSYAAAAGGLTSTTAVKAKNGAAGIRVCLNSIQIMNSHQTTSTEVLVYANPGSAASTDTLWRGWAQAAGGGASVPMPVDICSPALGDSLKIVEKTATGTAGVLVNLQGYTTAE